MGWAKPCAGVCVVVWGRLLGGSSAASLLESREQRLDAGVNRPTPLSVGLPCCWHEAVIASACGAQLVPAPALLQPLPAGGRYQPHQGEGWCVSVCAAAS